MREIHCTVCIIITASFSIIFLYGTKLDCPLTLFQTNLSSILTRLIIPLPLRPGVLCQQIILGCLVLPMTGMLTVRAAQVRGHCSPHVYTLRFRFPKVPALCFIAAVKQPPIKQTQESPVTRQSRVHLADI